MMKYFLLIATTVLLATQSLFAAGLINTTITNIGDNQVKVTLNSYDIDLNTSTIGWFKDNKTLAYGLGLNNVVLSANSGLVDIMVEERDGRQTKLQVNTLPPQTVDILWEAAGQVPLFYKGKTLPVSGGEVVFWVPAEKNDDPLIYDWLINGRKNYSSGAGNNVLKTRSFGGTTASVKISTLDGQTISSGPSLSVHGTSPRVILYKQMSNGEFIAISDKETLTISESKVTLRAVPMSFNRSADQLEPKWYINGKNITPNQSKFTFDIISDKQQTASVNIIMTNPENGQSANQNIIIDFRKNSLLF